MAVKMTKLLSLHKMPSPWSTLRRREVLHLSNPIANRLNPQKPLTEYRPRIPKPLALNRRRKFPVSMLSADTQKPEIEPSVDPKPIILSETHPANPTPPNFPTPLPLEIPTVPDISPSPDPSWPTKVPHMNPSPQPEIFPAARETTNPVSPPVEVAPRQQQRSYVKSSGVRDPPVYPPGGPPPDINPPLPPSWPDPPRPPPPPDVPPIPSPNFPPFPDPLPPDPFPPIPSPPIMRNSSVPNILNISGFISEMLARGKCSVF